MPASVKVSGSGPGPRSDFSQQVVFCPEKVFTELPWTAAIHGVEVPVLF